MSKPRSDLGQVATQWTGRNRMLYIALLYTAGGRAPGDIPIPFEGDPGRNFQSDLDAAANETGKELWELRGLPSFRRCDGSAWVYGDRSL